MRVNVVAKLGWILERLARELEALPGVTVNCGREERRALPGALNYYLPARDALRFPADGPKVGLYTHGVTAFEIAGEFDACVTMNLAMADRLRRETAAKRVVTIRPGTEYFARRRPVFGVVGRVYGKTRKGADLVAAAVADGFDFRACTDFRGKTRDRRYAPPCPVTHRVRHRAEFYASIDYLVVTSTDEGGPMPVLEAIASHVPVIAPDVGWCWEFPVIRYERGSYESLREVLRSLSFPPTWKAWTADHAELFESIS